MSGQYVSHTLLKEIKLKDIWQRFDALGYDHNFHRQFFSALCRFSATYPTTLDNNSLKIVYYLVQNCEPLIVRLFILSFFKSTPELLRTTIETQLIGDFHSKSFYQKLDVLVTCLTSYSRNTLDDKEPARKKLKVQHENCSELANLLSVAQKLKREDIVSGEDRKQIKATISVLENLIN